MSNQTGFDYDVMISRLHGGLCAFQSLRAHRRERAQAAAPPPPPATHPAPAAPPASRAAPVDDRAELHADLLGVMTATAASPPSFPATPTASPTPAVEEPRPPAPAASTLRLPPPTLPPRLGLILGGRPEPEPAPTPEPSSPPTGASPTPAQTPEAPRLAPIAALLDARAQEDAQRLERAQAEHRAAMTTLLRQHRDELRAQSEADAARTTALLRDANAEHRAELRAQSEADAARTTALLRDVFAEHRAELARANQAHADHLAQVLAQRSQSADPPAAAGDMVEMRAVLLEQASTQHKANEAVAEHIDALTSIIADLGHTVGTLAVAAAQKAQQSQRSVLFTFPPPPRVLTAVNAAAPDVDPATASPREQPTMIPASAESSPCEPAALTTTVHAASAESSPLASANSGPAAAASVPASSQATPAAAPVSLADAIASESPQSRAIQQMLQEAADRAHIHGELANDDDGDLTAYTDDDPERHPRLSPVTDIVPTTGEQGDD